MNLASFPLAARGALATTALLVLGAAGLQAQPVNAGNSGTLVVPRDRVLNESGHYVLNRNLMLGANDVAAGLTISADDVTLDLNGFSVIGPGQMMGVGILVDGAKGVTIRNGKVGDFHFNIQIQNSMSVTVEGLQIRGQGILPPAPPPETGVMIIQSTNVVVRGNSIVNTGLGIFVRGGKSRANRIEGNTVSSNTGGLLGICYNPAPDDPMGPRGNLVADNLVSGFNIGIQMKDVAMNNVVLGNTIAYNMGGIGLDFRNDTIVEANNVLIELP
ncbi:MAG: hypothetical protein GC160_29610 [Acidobacteria bacterium]|nr:hypothetical protein [Acidobacteriota bacterium]